MVDRIDKQLRKIDPRHRKKFERLLTCIVNGKLAGLDIVKLKGRNDTYRVRKGDYRIIFQKVDEIYLIIAFERRSDTTYE